MVTITTRPVVASIPIFYARYIGREQARIYVLDGLCAFTPIDHASTIKMVHAPLFKAVAPGFAFAHSAGRSRCRHGTAEHFAILAAATEFDLMTNVIFRSATMKVASKAYIALSIAIRGDAFLFSFIACRYRCHIEDGIYISTSTRPSNARRAYLGLNVIFVILVWLLLSLLYYAMLISFKVLPLSPLRLLQGTCTKSHNILCCLFNICKYWRKSISWVSLSKRFRAKFHFDGRYWHRTRFTYSDIKY